MSAVEALHERTWPLAGPDGPLHAVMSWPTDREPTHGVLVCPPSPLLGGDLENNVTQALARAAAARGLAALRFDYRNAGRSGGDTGGLPRSEWWHRRTVTHDIQPVIDDARCALAALEGFVPVRLVVGYSFGGIVAALLAAERSDMRVAMICPPLGLHPVPELAQIAERTLIVLAENDEIAPPPRRESLEESHAALRVVRLHAADHFLLDEELAAVEPILDWAVPGEPR